MSVVTANAQLELGNTSLQANQVLLELGLLLFQTTDLILQFDILDLLRVQVLFQVIFDSTALVSLLLTSELQAGGSF